jgi:hypothetical protein
MSSINRSPGAFIVLCAVMVYGVIGLEIAMWNVAAVVAVAVVLLVVIGLAVVILLAALRLIDEATDETSSPPRRDVQPTEPAEVTTIPELPVAA